jgi:1-acyl-sn-glycerol-3-phosphate acyltransferase
MNHPAPPPVDPLSPANTVARWAWHQTCYLSAMTFFTLGFSLRTHGVKNMPQSGPALVVSNHQSFLDPPIVGLAARRPLVYLARKTLFRNPYFASFIRSLNAVPIDQEGVGKEGIKTVVEQLKLGKAVLVFPEGERTPTGPMLPLKPGVHLLIKKAEAPIVPVGIAGAYEALPRWRHTPLFSPLFLPATKGAIAMVMGEPLDSRRYAAMPREDALRELFVKIKEVQEKAEKLRRK